MSSFPHAFERWEQLSSHWEGLTSYWLRKLETHQEEIARTVPSASAMSRQITDLSAAGANLFHAVVELQRLRASSERKFQRWFFEHKADQERAQEIHGELEKMLQLERQARKDAEKERTHGESEVQNAKRMVSEVRRELNISKEEARRAWEELGRREQEERDRTTSLREGMPTIVGGVQVVPMHASAGVSRQGSESQRPATREGAQYQVPSSAARSQPEYYEEQPSPTDTDPFTETSRAGPALHHEPGVQSLATGTYQPYPLGSTPATTSGSVQTAIPPSQQRQSAAPSQPSRVAPSPAAIAAQQAMQPSTAAAHQQHQAAFYQQPPAQTFLHSPHSSVSTSAHPSAPSTQFSAPPAHSAPLGSAAAQAAQDPSDLRSEPSYISSEGETEYEIDAAGNVRRDAQGRPIVFRPVPVSSGTGRRGTARSEESDEYDVEADVERERELARRYGVGASAGVGYPATGAQGQLQTAQPQQAQVQQGYSYVAPAPEPPTSEAPDYEGSGFGGWEAVQTRHHHPTRLSDVLEEDERSRTTAE